MARLAVATVAALTLGTAVAVLAIPTETTREVAAGPAPWPDPIWHHPIPPTTTTTTVPPSPRVLPGPKPGLRVPRRPAATVVPAHARPLAPRPATVAAPNSVWECIGQHESGNNPATNTGNGFSGMYQDTPSSWAAGGGLAYAQAAYLATPAQQLIVNENIQRQQGWNAWPQTSRMCGV